MNKNVNDFLDIVLEDCITNAVSPELYQYYQGLKENKIIINFPVTRQFVDYVIVPLLRMDNDPEVKHIEIILNCEGGSQLDGMYICNVIENLKTPTTITVLGYAYSMAGYFLMAGYNNPNVTRRCYPYSTYLLHAGSLGVEGEAKTVKASMNFMELQDKYLRDFVISHSKITPKEFKKMYATETYLFADDMLKYGIVDYIIGQEPKETEE